jgi:EAL and modified HD-GYP domain-containing signal transduction protein
VEDDAPSRITRAVHVGRQAIYDRAGDVVAYELLFRDAPEATEASRRTSFATSRVIVAAFTEFGIRELVDDRACFINVTREFLVGDLPIPFDAGQAGLEILADVPIDDEVVAGVAALSEQGYTIAVDDYRPAAGRDALLAYANYVKIDMLDPNPTRVRTAVAPCRAYPHLQLVAERLETPAGLSVAFDLGFELFQGHVLGRPHLVSTEVLNTTRLARLRLLAQLTDEDMDVAQVTAAIETDPGLSLRVLTGVNAAASGVNRRVSSVGDAVMLLGTRQIHQWVTLMLVSDLAEGDENRLTEAVTCARLCQTLAEHEGAAGSSAFTAGLLAAVSDILSLSTADLASRLPLTDEITDVMVRGEGPLAPILAAVRAYQHGIPAETSDLDVAGHFLAALRWSNGALRPARGPAVIGG